MLPDRAAASWPTQNEDYWERGPGSELPAIHVRYQNLGIYGWHLRDAPVVHRSPGPPLPSAGSGADDSIVGVKPDHDNDIAASSVLAPFGPDATQLSAAAWHGVIHGGIDTLVVALGANNALDARGQQAGQLVGSTASIVPRCRRTLLHVWKPPSHFAAEYAPPRRRRREGHRGAVGDRHHRAPCDDRADGQRREPPPTREEVAARLPVLPLLHRPLDRRRPASARTSTAHLTHQQARAIDSAIDQYNTTITSAVAPRA